MIYKVDGAEPTIQNGGSARLALQLPDLQALANALVPNLGNYAKTRPCTAPTLNRSTLSEAKAASAARPARVFADEGGKYGKGLRPQGVRGNSIPPCKTRRPVEAVSCTGGGTRTPTACATRS